MFVLAGVLPAAACVSTLLMACWLWFLSTLACCKKVCTSAAPRLMCKFEGMAPLTLALQQMDLPEPTGLSTMFMNK
jgi:hypothetical protein